MRLLVIHSSCHSDYVVNTSFDGLLDIRNGFTMSVQMETTNSTILLERISVEDRHCNDTAEFVPCDCSADELAIQPNAEGVIL